MVGSDALASDYGVFDAAAHETVVEARAFAFIVHG